MHMHHHQMGAIRANRGWEVGFCANLARPLGELQRVVDTSAEERAPRREVGCVPCEPWKARACRELCEVAEQYIEISNACRHTEVVQAAADGQRLRR